MPIDSLIVLLVGIIFLILYAVEKEFEFKWYFFFIGMAFIAIAFLANQQLQSTTTNSITGVTTYLYGPDSTLDTLAYVIGVIGVVALVIFGKKAISGVMGWKT